MRITKSARKHGMSDADILHAYRSRTRPLYLGENKMLYVGFGCDTTPLEIVVIEDEDPRLIHAMKARPKYWP